MASIRKRLSYANVMATIAVFLALGGGAFAAVNGIPGKDGTITACFKKKGGALRAVKQGAKCKRGEEKLVWNQKGLKGDMGNAGAAGAAGAAGSNASINGVSAGGDLSGTYPNPTIASGAVGTSQIGSIPQAKLMSSSPTTLPSSASPSILSWNTEVFDTANMFSFGTPDRLTVTVSGVYALTATVDWNSSGGTTGSREIGLSKNGGTSLLVRRAEPGMTTDVEQNISTIAQLDAGDYVRLYGAQTSGSTLAINQFTDETPVFAMSWLGSGN